MTILFWKELIGIIFRNFMPNKYSLMMLNYTSFSQKHIYPWILVLLAVCMPVSEFGISVSMFLLATNWLIERDFKEKWRRLKSNNSLLIFLGFLPVHVLWLINSSDLMFGLLDLKVKLPILILPFILGSSRPLRRKEINNILWFFTATVLVASFISMGAYLGFGGFEYTNIREISLFISHIRFALMIDLAIFHVIYFLFKNIHRQKVWLSGLQFLILIWLIVFLFLLKSLTGIVILIIVGTVLTVIFIRKLSNLALKYLLSILLITGFVVLVFGVSNYYARFSFIETMEIESLEARTMNGNAYTHEIENTQLENGKRVWLYYCEEELIEAWNNRSEFEFWGEDKRGQDLRITLIRYLSSKGFRKDSLGLVSLGEEDIKNIENGLANFIYADKISFYPVFYEIMWQIREYRNVGDPSAHSITQRFEFLNTGISIVRNNFWFGVGTGDVPGAFEEQYKTDDSQLEKEWRLRTHNQYLTFFISFGFLGFILIMFIFLFPIFREKAWKSYYSGIFLAIVILSMLNEDTLETSVGAVFFSYFYALFLFSKQTEKLNEPE